ncbi:MFS transporter, DHA1 family, multidrug resistance protein [Streptomyces sp. TLI_053]|uniref:MFS transporter n=1 Tax=Streptomyces sp. TLI_053 TaxID=1855352 RepID=UPI00087D78D5|nr:MFS transporter [Streptomyces sp. TLI_053]SDT83250.1 MFS transporter, DHA1 family, multidrug resistance protein [Streptomyces sp. TLI_053]
MSAATATPPRGRSRPSTWSRTSATGRALLTTVLTTGVTTFMFLPLLALHLSATGTPVGRVGLLIGLLSLCGQGFSVLSGHLVDRVGARTTTTAGFACRIVGYLLISAGGAALVPGIAAVGIGGSLLVLSVKTRLVIEAAAHDDTRGMLALRSTFGNVGVVLGPVLGAVAYPLGFDAILAAAVLSHLGLGFHLTFLAKDEAAQAPADLAFAPAAPERKPDPGHTATAPGRRGPAVLFLAAVAYWALYSQLNAVIPLTARALTGTTVAITVVFTLNGALVLLFQYTLLRRFLGHLPPRTLLTAGFAAFAVAYLVLLPQAGWLSLLLFTVPATLAEMLIGPSLDELAVTTAPPRRTGRALGLLGLAGAIGSPLGAGLGTHLLQSLHGGPAVWLTVTTAAALAAAACLLLPRPAR